MQTETIRSFKTPITRNSDHDCAVVVVYDTHSDAESSIRHFKLLRFDLRGLSIVGKDHQSEETMSGYRNAGDRMKAWGRTGTSWGSIWGLIFGSGIFVVPGIGPLFVAGPLVGWTIAALEGAATVHRLSVIGAGLYNLGIPKNRIREYETSLKSGKFIVVAHSTEAAISCIEGSLRHNGAKLVDIYPDKEVFDDTVEAYETGVAVSSGDIYQSDNEPKPDDLIPASSNVDERYYNYRMSNREGQIF